MHHHPAVAQSPAWAALALIADEPVFDAESVVAELIAEEEVSEAFAEFRITGGFIPDLEESFFDAEGVVIVVSEIAEANFGCPALKVFAVEQGHPFIFGISGIRRLLVCGCEWGSGSECEKQSED
jgi:hypothetical protein